MKNTNTPLGQGAIGALLLVGAACWWPAVHAQGWQWTDEAGRKVFSDRPPPPSVSERNITKRPDTPLPASAAAATAPASTASAPAAGTDSELEKRKNAAEQNDAAKQKIVEQQNAKIRADNCKRAKSAKSTMDSGVRLSTTNAKGERVIMDDAMRTAEMRRLNEVIQRNCGPLPAEGKAGQ